MQCCNLSGKTAIVTGASKGIGKSIAIKLALYGAKISLVARNKDNLDIVKTAPKVHFLCDFSLEGDSL